MYTLANKVYWWIALLDQPDNRAQNLRLPKIFVRVLMFCISHVFWEWLANWAKFNTRTLRLVLYKPYFALKNTYLWKKWEHIIEFYLDIYTYQKNLEIIFKAFFQEMWYHEQLKHHWYATFWYVQYCYLTFDPRNLTITPQKEK